MELAGQLTILASGFYNVATDICMIFGAGIKLLAPGKFVVTLPQPYAIGELLVLATIDNPPTGSVIESNVGFSPLTNEIEINTSNGAVFGNESFSFVVYRQNSGTPVDVNAGLPPV